MYSWAVSHGESMQKYLPPERLTWHASPCDLLDRRGRVAGQDVEQAELTTRTGDGDLAVGMGQLGHGRRRDEERRGEAFAKQRDRGVAFADVAQYSGAQNDVLVHAATALDGER